MPRPIAIAYDCLFPFTTGGGERQYRAFAEELHRGGFDVDYLTATQWPAEVPEPAGFRVVPVSGPLRLYTPDGVRRSAAAAVFAWGLFRGLLRRRHSYEAVVVSGLPVLNVFAARAALAGSGTRLIVDYLEVWGRAQWLQYAGAAMGTVAWLLQRVAIALTPTATCHSALTARRLRAEGLRGELLVSPGLITAPESAPPPVQPAATPPYVLYAGRHIPDKRVEALPGALALVRERVRDVRLVILGDGPSRPAVQAEADRVDGQHWTEFPGFVAEDELARFMAGAACLVNPSRREGYGLVVVESAAYGTPVALVDDEGNAATELIDHDRNGAVAASASPSDLAAAILRVLDGGDALRASTRAWYDEAVRTRTVAQTVAQIIDDLDARPARRRGKTKGDRS